MDRSRDRASLKRDGTASNQTRFVIVLLLLKHIHGWSNDSVSERSVFLAARHPCAMRNRLQTCQLDLDKKRRSALDQYRARLTEQHCWLH